MSKHRGHRIFLITYVFAGSFRMSFVIELGCPQDLGNLPSWRHFMCQHCNVQENDATSHFTCQDYKGITSFDMKLKAHGFGTSSRQFLTKTWKWKSNLQCFNISLSGSWFRSHLLKAESPVVKRTRETSNKPSSQIMERTLPPRVHGLRFFLKP